MPPTSTAPPTPTPTPIPPPAPTPQPGGFGLSITDGALFANDPVVTVRAWAPNVTHMRLSNDGGFADSTWQTYRLTTTWVLSTYGNTVMPRVVYAQFQGEGGAIYGTYMDDIVYDPVAPEDSVSILGGETSTVTLWLEAWDDNSGVDRMQAAAGLDGIGIAAWQPYINTLEWMLTGDVVYAQFKDRAGNVSSIYDSNGNEWEAVFRVFLPLVVRSH